jgi:hypothetical protein
MCFTRLHAGGQRWGWQKERWPGLSSSFSFPHFLSILLLLSIWRRRPQCPTPASPARPCQPHTSAWNSTYDLASPTPPPPARAPASPAHSPRTPPTRAPATPPSCTSPRHTTLLHAHSLRLTPTHAPETPPLVSPPACTWPTTLPDPCPHLTPPRVVTRYR